MQSLFAVFAGNFETRRWIGALSLLTAAIVASASLTQCIYGDEPLEELRKAPKLAGIGHWFNSAPITMSDQKGKVVVLHFWCFGCINCQRNLPNYNQWRKDFAEDDVQIIGIHTPETAEEDKMSNVKIQVKKRGIKYPVAVDSEGATWKAYENRYWPTVYLIDQDGRVRYRWEGELEYQKAGGDRIVREKIKALLAEHKP